MKIRSKQNFIYCPFFKQTIKAIGILFFLRSIIFFTLRAVSLPPEQSQWFYLYPPQSEPLM